MNRRIDSICPTCEKKYLDIFVTDSNYPLCECGTKTEWLPSTGKGSVHGDELPSGYMARHGVCWPDGTPRRFDTMTELKRALNEKGLCIVGDTPGKPYKVKWSGIVNKNVGQ